MRVVIETNVAIAANGRHTHASVTCQYECVDFIEQLVNAKSKHQIILDDLGLILGEYRGYLNYRGQPGVGDMFYKYVHDHMHTDNKVELVAITASNDELRGFDELPENSLDKSDRKFLAVAVVASAEIVNATDSDWHLESDLLDSLGISLIQLCPEHANKA